MILIVVDARPYGCPSVSRRVRVSALQASFGVLSLLLVSLVSSAVAAETGISSDELAAVRATEAARVAAIEKVYGAVVAIYGNDRQGGGSGVLYDPAGYALTNFHVVSGAGEEGWAGLADGKFYRWKLLGFDPGGDLAVIRLLGQEQFPSAPIGDSGRVRVGDWAMAMGNPFTLAEDQKPTVTLGIVGGVERYQPGSGLNALVYGNCIQVDSSINPGNSGGPLFNLAGEVIGINGRASFEERGRVNVGVGYAISAEQAKNFLPDLLATKICEHGTLDAVFEDRDGQTICSQINLDAAIAKLGLQLGDRLVSFDGHPIHGANQLANIISTLPAGWPVEVAFEHEGETKAVWLRLDSLPYEKRLLQPRPGTPSGGDEKDPKPPKPGEPPRGAPEQPAPAAKVALQAEPGEIRSRELNEQECRRLLKRFAAGHASPAGGPGRPSGGRLQVLSYDDRFGPGPIALREWTWSSDGRFREDHLDVDTQQSSGVSYGFDGEHFWRRDADGKVTSRKGDDFELQRTEHLPLLVLGALYREDPSDGFAELKLEGGDKAAQQRAYRVRATLKAGPTIYLWFSVLDEGPGPAPKLLKIAAEGSDGEVAPTAWLVDVLPSPAVASSGSWLTLVEGLPERRLLKCSMAAPEFFYDPLPEDQFKQPAQNEAADE